MFISVCSSAKDFVSIYDRVAKVVRERGISLGRVLDTAVNPPYDRSNFARAALIKVIATIRISSCMLIWSTADYIQNRLYSKHYYVGRICDFNVLYRQNNHIMELRLQAAIFSSHILQIKVFASCPCIPNFTIIEETYIIIIKDLMDRNCSQILILLADCFNSREYFMAICTVYIAVLTLYTATLLDQFAFLFSFYQLEQLFLQLRKQ